MAFDDRTLIAYLDGQLPDANYGPLEEALQHNEALRLRLQALADASELARRAFDPVLLEPVPPQLIAAIWRAPDPRVLGTSPRVKGPSWGRLRSWFGLGSGPSPWTALAPLTVLGLGVVIGWSLLAPPGDARWALREGAAVTNEALALSLEVSPSGRVLRTAGGAVEILASFEQPSGGHCREFTRSSPRGTLHELGIACRNKPGDWQLELLAAEDRTVPHTEARYQTTSDQQHDRADDFLRTRAMGQPLNDTQERALIDSGWTR